MKRLLKLDQAADYLGMSPSWLKKQIRAKEIRIVLLGRSVRIAESDLEEFIERRKKPVGENVGTPCVSGGTPKDSSDSDVVEMTGGRRR